MRGMNILTTHDTLWSLPAWADAKACRNLGGLRFDNRLDLDVSTPAGRSQFGVLGDRQERSRYLRRGS